MKTIAFFNNKGGVGKTTIAYHLAWMYADTGLSVVAADLDPQANLTAMFLDDSRLEEVWPDDADHPLSILGAVEPILRGIGDINPAHGERVEDHLTVVVGDLGLSRFEARLATSWPECMNRDEAAFRAQSAFYRILSGVAARRHADVVLMDVGPNLGAINRAALLAADFVVFPLGPDLFSLQGLRNLGPTLSEWRAGWQDRLDRRPTGPDLALPDGGPHPAGYVVMQHAVRANRPVHACEQWIRRIPGVYRVEICGDAAPAPASGADDPYCLGTLKHYRSLIPMAQEARKPVFALRAADGALGGHYYAVMDCREDFERLARSIADSCGIAVPE